MAEKTVKLYYKGPDGAHNYDVAEATGGPAKLKTRSHYEVPPKLAERLLRTTDWQHVGGSPRSGKKKSDDDPPADSEVNEEAGDASTDEEPNEEEAVNE